MPIETGQKDTVEKGVRNTGKIRISDLLESSCWQIKHHQYIFALKSHIEFLFKLQTASKIWSRVPNPCKEKGRNILIHVIFIVDQIRKIEIYGKLRWYARDIFELTQKRSLSEGKVQNLKRRESQIAEKLYWNFKFLEEYIQGGKRQNNFNFYQKLFRLDFLTN